MKQINLTKYGFVRSPEDDFSDDGTRFTCYRVGRVIVSKATWRDRVYIDGSINGNLPYDVYGRLPHYIKASALNGVDRDIITEQDLINLYEACIAYEKEYSEAESKIVYPTRDEIKAAADRINDSIQKQLTIIEDTIKADPMKLLTLSDYDLKDVKNYYASLKRLMYSDDGIDRIVDTAYSCNFVKPETVLHHCSESFYYKKVMEILTK